MHFFRLSNILTVPIRLQSKLRNENENECLNYSWYIDLWSLRRCNNSVFNGNNYVIFRNINVLSVINNVEYLNNSNRVVFRQDTLKIKYFSWYTYIYPNSNFLVSCYIFYITFSYSFIFSYLYKFLCELYIEYIILLNLFFFIFLCKRIHL